MSTRGRGGNDFTMWVPTAKGLRALGVVVPDHIPDHEALLPVAGTVTVPTPKKRWWRR